MDVKLIVLMIKYFDHHNANIEYVKVYHQSNKDVLLNDHMLNDMVYSVRLEQL